VHEVHPGHTGMLLGQGVMEGAEERGKGKGQEERVQNRLCTLNQVCDTFVNFKDSKLTFS
jgi:hypothetical protein